MARRARFEMTGQLLSIWRRKHSDAPKLLKFEIDEDGGPIRITMMKTAHYVEWGRRYAYLKVVDRFILSKREERKLIDWLRSRK